MTRKASIDEVMTSSSPATPPGAAPAVLLIDDAIALAMHRVLPVQSREQVMDRFGISVNTWIKIRDGIPIRRSVAERLLERLRRDGLID